ncbi:MAG: GNAT family N-acetyltransferase [Pyrinomonadaceae bacterium]|nr:GNAT family N-acetyltransferase [Pyrinomonadaceae bacterium]
MEYEVRKACPENASVLSAIAFESKAYWGYSEEFMEACRDEIEVTKEKMLQKRFQFVSMSIGGKIVGFYSLERISEEAVELEALFVAPGFIGKRIGRALFESAVETAVSGGFEEMLIVSDPNAAGFYKAAGCEQVGDEESESIPGRMLPLFRIGLRSPK